MHIVSIEKDKRMMKKKTTPRWRRLYIYGSYFECIYPIPFLIVLFIEKPYVWKLLDLRLFHRFVIYDAHTLMILSALPAHCSCHQVKHSSWIEYFVIVTTNRFDARDASDVHSFGFASCLLISLYCFSYQCWTLSFFCYTWTPPLFLSIPFPFHRPHSMQLMFIVLMQ